MGAPSIAVTAAPEPPHPFNKNLCWLLSRTSWILTTELTAALEGLGVSPRGHSVLVAALTGGHTQTELARMIGLDKTTMVVTLDELEAAGLAERRLSKEDRRARVVVVTAAGKRKVRKAEEISEQIHEHVLAVLPPEERRVFLDSLCRIASECLTEPADCKASVRRRAPRT